MLTALAIGLAILAALGVLFLFVLVGIAIFTRYDDDDEFDSRRPIDARKRTRLLHQEENERFANAIRSHHERAAERLKDADGTASIDSGYLIHDDDERDR